MPAGPKIPEMGRTESKELERNWNASVYIVQVVYITTSLHLKSERLLTWAFDLDAGAQLTAELLLTALCELKVT